MVSDKKKGEKILRDAEIYERTWRPECVRAVPFNVGFEYLDLKEKCVAQNDDTRNSSKYKQLFKTYSGKEPSVRRRFYRAVSGALLRPLALGFRKNAQQNTSKTP